ncbi:hypothetical protein E5D57_003189 [Metarhizium anisopliae]|nr:hypothetical protein E5D57_003189 [Metarhizium anisopliae]
MIAVNPLVSFKQIGQFTAQIMSYLLEHKDCPKLAAQGATNWAGKERGEKQGKSRRTISKLVTEPLGEGLWMTNDRDKTREI